MLRRNRRDEMRKLFVPSGSLPDRAEKFFSATEIGRTANTVKWVGLTVPK